MIPIGKETYETMPDGYKPYVYRHKDATKIICVLANRIFEGHDDLHTCYTRPRGYAFDQLTWVCEAVEHRILQMWEDVPHKPTDNPQRVMDMLMDNIKVDLLAKGETDVDRRGPEWEVTVVSKESHIYRYRKVAFKVPRGRKWDVFMTCIHQWIGTQERSTNTNVVDIRYVTVRFPRQHRGRLPPLVPCNCD